jgi:hypothetical protein
MLNFKFINKYQVLEKKLNRMHPKEREGVNSYNVERLVLFMQCFYCVVDSIRKVPYLVLAFILLMNVQFKLILNYKLDCTMDNNAFFLLVINFVPSIAFHAVSMIK